MYNFIYRKRVLQIILAVAIAAFMVARLMLAPAIFYKPHVATLLYPVLYDFFLPHPIGFRIALALFIAIQVFVFQEFISRHNFLDSASLMPVIWFLFFSLFTSDFPAFSQSLLLNFLIIILLSLNINSLNSSNEDNRRHVFWAGVIVAMATLVEPAAILLFFIICAALITGKTNFLKRLCLALTGLFMPFLYIAVIFFLTGRMTILLDYFSRQQFFAFLFIDCEHALFISFCIVFLLTLLYTLPALKLYYDNRVILLRKEFLIVNMAFLLIVLIVLTGNHSFTAGLPYLVVPFSIYFSMLCQLRRNRITADILMTAFVVIILLIKILA